MHQTYQRLENQKLGLLDFFGV